MFCWFGVRFVVSVQSFAKIAYGFQRYCLSSELNELRLTDALVYFLFDCSFPVVVMVLLLQQREREVIQVSAAVLCPLYEFFCVFGCGLLITKNLLNYIERERERERERDLVFSIKDIQEMD